MIKKGDAMSKKLLGGSNLFMILGLLFIAVIGFRTISTPEIWTHLAQGQNNVPLSFLDSDTTVNTTWLYDKLTYAAWNLGKAPLLILLNIAGMVAAFALLIQVAKKWGGPLSQGFALLIAGQLLFQSVDVGPETIMMLFIALFLYLLEKLKAPALLFGMLVPLQILWTNLHGSFLFGPAIAVLTAIQISQTKKVSGRTQKQPISSGLMFGVAGALALATLINPYFTNLHAQVIANVVSPAPLYWSSLFLEYFQVPPRKPLIFFTLILGAGGLITLKKRLPIVLTTLAIVGAFLAWSSPKTTPLFAVLSLPFIVLSLSAISEYIGGTLESVLGKQAKLLVPATGIVFVLLIILSIIPIVGNCAYTKTGSASNFGMGIEEQLYPDGAEAILNHPAFPQRIINLPADGGYLAFNYGRKVFTDYRSGRYDQKLLTDLNALMAGSKQAYNTIYEKHRPEAFIINTLTPAAAQGISTLLRLNTWKLAYFDGTTAILLLNKEKFAPILDNTDIQQSGLQKLEAARAAYAAAVGKGCKAGNPAELIGSGKIFLALNRATEAKAIFSLLLQGNSTIPGAWIGLGNSQLLLKEFDDAVVSLGKATELAPNSWIAWASYAEANKLAGNTATSEMALAKAQQLAEQNRPAEQEEEPEALDSEDSEDSDTPLQNITIPK
jgi:tetratricopeptide (TPR) repeat protein